MSYLYNSNIEMAKSTIQIIKHGNYMLDDGTVCDLSKRAMHKAVLYHHEGTVKRDKEAFDRQYSLSKAEVMTVPLTTLGCVKQITGSGSNESSGKTAVLCFGSPFEAGGGFKKGWLSQEETLCYHTTLYDSISSKKASDYYKYQAEKRRSTNTNAVIFSPTVYVIRDEGTKRLIKPIEISVLTCSAVDWRRHPRMVLRNNSKAIQEGYDEMRERIRRVLTIAVNEGCDNIVLGAWGCGMYRTDARIAMTWFQEMIVGGNFLHYFRRIYFAVPDEHSDEYSAFKLLERRLQGKERIV